MSTRAPVRGYGLGLRIQVALVGLMPVGFAVAFVVVSIVNYPHEGGPEGLFLGLGIAAAVGAMGVAIVYLACRQLWVEVGADGQVTINTMGFRRVVVVDDSCQLVVDPWGLKYSFPLLVVGRRRVALFPMIAAPSYLGGNGNHYYPVINRLNELVNSS